MNDAVNEEESGVEGIILFVGYMFFSLAFVFLSLVAFNFFLDVFVFNEESSIEYQEDLYGEDSFLE